ncbi:MAG: bifunctional (p)ppGpp synthetase/guanosine-3',5'-bis(diphosphate) 3'-pyrophosphohydrolase [Gallionella sp.]|nr:bifunctional (p)ppGpp synthetase/guanosine-3',5'-bis(diphosphate) 3'-pyrophosphohydrolase [Gallionella sp.]
MVSTQTKSPQNFSSDDTWLDSFSPDEIAALRRACELTEPLYAEQTEVTGTPLMQHALGAAGILVGMNMDAETIIATILHAVPQFMDNWAITLEEQFGPAVMSLLKGISRTEQIQQFSEIRDSASKDKKNDNQAQQLEGLRKMLLAMVGDIRVVLIKLAERAQTMRSLSGAEPEQRRQIARETQTLFAPLANRLGVWQIKWELEDLSVRYLQPELYKQIATLLDERRLDRENYIADVIQQLRAALDGAGIKGEVTGRPKHIYSIINKMKRKQLDFNELYDVRAVRILVDDVQDCYAALGLVQELWLPIASEFDDYIAHPKSNNYRSLHTAVLGPRNLAVEIQIRTHEMHQHSELGVAAHWRYKEGGKSDAKLNQKIVWLRQLLEWKEDLAERGDMQEQFRNELIHDQVYVFTPQGKVIALPQGGTPLDFAYTLHTNLGHRTRGAKVDGNIVPLTYQLQNGQKVEILTTKLGGPSLDWANPSQGYLKSQSSRNKVRAWFKSLHSDEHVAQGRLLLERELHRLGVTAVNQEKIAQRLRYPKLEDMLAAIGENRITLRRIALAIQAEYPTKQLDIVKPPPPRADGKPLQPSPIVIVGLGRQTTRTAQCCHPTPPDAIVGYLTRDRGITIHRQDCEFLLHQTETRSDRLLDADWGSE